MNRSDDSFLTASILPELFFTFLYYAIKIVKSVINVHSMYFQEYWYHTCFCLCFKDIRYGSDLHFIIHSSNFQWNISRYWYRKWLLIRIRWGREIFENLENLLNHKTQSNKSRMIWVWRTFFSEHSNNYFNECFRTCAYAYHSPGGTISLR